MALLHIPFLQGCELRCSLCIVGFTTEEKEHVWLTIKRILKLCHFHSHPIDEERNVDDGLWISPPGLARREKSVGSSYFGIICTVLW